MVDKEHDDDDEDSLFAQRRRRPLEPMHGPFVPIKLSTFQSLRKKWIKRREWHTSWAGGDSVAWTSFHSSLSLFLLSLSLSLSLSQLTGLTTN